ncbi:MAG: RDD family protein [Candidatus Aenigmatarchaeota archaeon]
MKLQKALYWERLFAWLIDILIITIISCLITGNWAFSSMISSSHYIALGIIAFLYWTILESMFAQSVGKKIMALKILTKKGELITMQQSAIQSFGKSFLLPIDVIAGLLYQHKERTRAFCILADTIVVKI